MPRISIAEDETMSIGSLSRALRSGTVSCEELTQAALNRIEVQNPTLNAVVSVAPDQVLQQARGVDREIRAGRWRGPLHGIPLGLKDVIDCRGMRTTMGSAFCQDNVARSDASAVRRLRRAGAVLIGKLHTHEYAFGATGEESHIGPCRNPHGPGRITGGSSSGPAAAVASGMCVAALGTDSGGSVRIPAALCGVVGLKPTMGRISRSGVGPLSWTLDHVGAITHSIADNAVLLTVLSGFDPSDPKSTRRRPEDFARYLGEGVRGLRIGLPSSFFEYLDPLVRSGVDEALRVWRDRGCELCVVDLPQLDRFVTAQRTVLATEAYAIHRQRFEEQPQLFQESVGQRLHDASMISAWRYAESYRLIDDATRTFDRALADVDVLATATVPILAPLLGQWETCAAGLAESVQSALTRLTGATNFTGHPSLTMPSPGSQFGLPVGVQLIGRRWAEALLYRFGQTLEASTASHTESFQ
jgi:aspartyl-tRNA(Asn)/glutamyl-tRNA(Gln) amidotransferase subunit A